MSAGDSAFFATNGRLHGEPVTMTREQFLKLDPHFRTSVNAPKLRTRHLPDGTILRQSVAVELLYDGKPAPYLPEVTAPGAKVRS